MTNDAAAPVAEMDPARVDDFVQHVLGSLGGAATVQMAYLGDRLGLYRALAEQGPATPAELGSRTGCAERYLREWLAQQAAAGFTTHDSASGRFSLPPEHAAVLADEGAPAAFGGMFEALAGWSLDLDRLAADFQNADGIGWSEHDRELHDGVARFFGTAYRTHLVEEWVAALGLDDVLRRGALVADVGCGQGVSTVLLAAAYPHSRFIGFDAHGPSLDAARQRAAEAAVADRIQFEIADVTGFGGGPYDVIWFFDVLHDLGDPRSAAAHACSRLAEGGTVALIEPFALDSMADNIAGNAPAVLHYTASTVLCVPHALSEPGQAALGAQAGGQVIADVLRDAGLARVDRVATTPLHAVYAARP